MKFLDIAEVATRSGLRPSTLRYYEELGLISALARHGLRRQYGPETITQLALIALAKSAGFPLAEISRMFGKDGMPDLPRSDFRKKAEDMDRHIARLTELSKMLRHIADCRAPTHMECPTFRRLLQTAVQDQAGSRKNRGRHHI